MSRSPTYFSLADDIRMIGKSYFRIDPWAGQNVVVEAWCEKDNMLDLIDDMVSGYRVHVQSVSGFSSAEPIHNAAERFRNVPADKEIYVYYHGDCDPSGLSIEQAVYAELWDEGIRRMHFIRVAITPEQARQLPPEKAQPFRLRDPRLNDYRRTYPGLKAYEFDCYPTDVLERDLQARIESHIDKDAWNAALRLEKAIQDWITRQASELLGGETASWESAIRHDDVLVDPQTGEPFPQDMLVQYLGPHPDDNDDDGGSPDGDDDGSDSDGDHEDAGEEDADRDGDDAAGEDAEAIANAPAGTVVTPARLFRAREAARDRWLDAADDSPEENHWREVRDTLDERWDALAARMEPQIC